MLPVPPGLAAGQPPPLVRKLSFGTPDETTTTVLHRPAASPDTMPGEIFQLENIVEEPQGMQSGHQHWVKELSILDTSREEIRSLFSCCNAPTRLMKASKF